MNTSFSRKSTLVSEAGGFEEGAKIFAILSLSEINAPVESLNCGFRTDPPRVSPIYL